MHFFVRAVVTGFGFTLGAMLFKKVAKQLGLEDAPKPGEAVAGVVSATPDAPCH